jgi:uncharacterized protein (DUF433 family)
MVDSVDIGTLITRTPGIKGGVPHIAGTGVTVHRVASWCKQGFGPEEIADQFGDLSLAQVHAALAYYHADRGEIEALLKVELTASGRRTTFSRARGDR